MAYEDRERTALGRIANNIADRTTIALDRTIIEVDILLGSIPKTARAEHSARIADWRKERAPSQDDRIEPTLRPFAATSTTETTTATAPVSGSPSLQRGTEAYDLVMDLKSNLAGSTNDAYDIGGPQGERQAKDNALDAIERTFSNPQAAAYLAAHGKNPETMAAQVESGNLKLATQSIPEREQIRAASTPASSETSQPTPILASSSTVKDAAGLQSFKAMNDAKRETSEAKGRDYRAGFIAADKVSETARVAALPSQSQRDSARTVATVAQAPAGGQQQVEVKSARASL